MRRTALARPRARWPCGRLLAGRRRGDGRRGRRRPGAPPETASAAARLRPARRRWSARSRPASRCRGGWPSCPTATPWSPSATRPACSTIAGPDHKVTEVGTVGEAAPQGEGGLLGVAVSPAYDQDQHAVLLPQQRRRQPDRHRHPRGRRGSATTTPILTGIPLGGIHDGGRLAFGPDGMLYASTGETGDGELAQDRDSPRRQDPAAHPAGRAGARQPVRHRGLVVRPPQRAGAGLRRRPAVGLGVRPEHLRRAEPDRRRRQLRLAESTRAPAARPRATPTRRPPGAPTSPRPPAWPTPTARSGWAPLRGNRLWKIPVDADQAAGQPEAYFVGEYGRMRTVVAAPDGNLWVTTSNRDGRGDPGRRRRPDPAGQPGGG